MRAACRAAGDRALPARPALDAIAAATNEGLADRREPDEADRNVVGVA